MKRKKLETFMKLTCVALSAAMLVTSIPVNAAGVSENSVDTVTEVSTESNSDTDTNADVDVKNEADNTEETNTEVDTESNADEEIVETDIDAEDGQDETEWYKSNLNIFELDINSATDQEINSYLFECADVDIATWLNSLSEDQLSILLAKDTMLNKQYDYYGDTVNSELGLETGHSFDTALDYFNAIYESTKNNVKIAEWEVTKGYFYLAFPDGTSVVNVSGIDTSRKSNLRQKNMTYSISNPRYNLRITGNFTHSWHLINRSGDANTDNVNLTKAANEADAKTLGYAHGALEVSFDKPAGYTLSTSESGFYGNSRHAFYRVFETTSVSGVAFVSGYPTDVGQTYAAVTIPMRCSINLMNMGLKSDAYGNVYHETWTATFNPAQYTATFAGAGAATWTYGSSDNRLPAAPSAPNFSAAFSDGGGSVSGARAFSGWTIRGVGGVYAPGTVFSTNFTNNVIFDPVWGNATLRAPGALATKKYIVTYDGNGGGVPQKASDIVTVPFSSWNVAGVGNVSAGANFAVGSNTSATANWGTPSTVILPNATPTNYTVSFDTKGGNSLSPKTTNRTFKGWNSAGNAGAAYRPSGDVTLKAAWSDASVTLPTATKTGYTFTGWSVEAAKGSIAGNTLTVKNTDVTATANYTANTYTVKFNANGGNGEMADQAITYDKDATLSDNVFTRDNYTFRGWSTDPNGSAMYTDKQSVKNLTAENGAVVTLYAVWTKNQYTINFDGNGGSVTTPSMVANMGEDVQLPTATKQYKVDFATNGGYLQNNVSTSKIVDVEFRGWSTNKDFVEGTDKLYTGNEKDLPTVNVNGESVTTLYAVWGKNPSIELPKAAKDGYTFVNWSFTNANGISEAKENGNIEVYSNMTITASWIKIDPNGPEIPTPTPSKDYTEEMKNILNILQNITTTQDLTSQQISQLTTLIKEVCFNDVDPAVVEKLVDMIKNSNLSENVKKAIFEALASGSISKDLKSTLIDAIKNSNLSEYEKSQLISAIEKMSTLSLDEQKKILQLLTQGSSVTYKIDGIEYLLKKNADGTLTIGIKNLNGKENVVIPDSVTVAGVTTAVTEVSKEAFKNNTIIKTVTMGNNVTKIGDSAFEGCKNLKSVTIGPAVTNIGNKAFKGCTSLTKINIPKSVLKIGNNAFEGCSKLKTVIFHEGLLQIGNKAFYKCSALIKVKLPKSLLKAGSYAFSKCKKLKTVTFATDANVTTLGKGIFADNASFKTIKIPSKVTAISTKMFRNDKKLSKVTGLSGVTKINANAFENCKSLKTITLQKNVQTIGSKAFYNCSKLSKVTIKSNAVTSIGSKAFKKCKKAIKFKVPNSKVNTYKKLLKGKY